MYHLTTPGKLGVSATAGYAPVERLHDPAASAFAGRGL
jgi:hypothetical protein